MNYIISGLNLVVLAAIFVVLLLLRHYLPSYTKKKGENLATKEDVGDITDRIERVKALYSSQLEEIKATISSIRNEREEFNKSRRECLLNFYDQIVEFYYEKIAVNFGDFPMDDGASMAGFQDEFNKLITAMLKSYQRIVVYFDQPEPVRIESENIVNEVLAARTAFKKHFGNVKLTHINECQAWQSGDRGRIDIAVPAANEANIKYWDAMGPVVEKLKLSLQRYLLETNKSLKPAETSNIPEAIFATDDRKS
ncbi:hypothetical protein [Citrifermentans bemidjiense]|nr:hypothetical protein [Citrifermentans bemidjiense]